MFKLMLLTTYLFTLSYSAQEKITSIEVATPRDWGKEIIKLPPAFAPDMQFRGTEDIRFSPGMFDSESDLFFTYVFLLSGKCGENLDQKAVESEILTYYKGLGQAVGGKKFKIDTNTFKINLKSVNKSEYTGSLDWIEPFKTGKKQTLNLKIYTWETKEKHFLFAMVSPKDFDSTVWKSLAEIHQGLIIK